MKIRSLLGFVIFAAVFLSCKKEKDPANPFNENLESCVLIVDQGNFEKSNGDISFFNRITKKSASTVFSTINNRPLGDVVQSISRFNSKYYIVVNNSDKIEIVQEGSFRSIGVINDLQQPRYFLGISSTKAYVSEWQKPDNSGIPALGTIAVIDLSTNTITKRITAGFGAENMLKAGNFVYVANSGGFGVDSTVTVIDYTTDAVVATIAMESNPQGFIQDKDGKIWTLCGGLMNWLTYAMTSQPALVRINPDGNSVEATYSMSAAPGVASNISTNAAKDKIFFNINYGNGVYAFDISASSIDPAPVLNVTLTGFGVDPKNDYLYCADPGDYATNGTIRRYNSAYQIVDSFKVGLVPGGFLFN